MTQKTKESIIFDASLDVGPSDVGSTGHILDDVGFNDAMITFPGRLYIFVEPSREYMVFPGDVAGYMSQLKRVLDEIDDGGGAVLERSYTRDRFASIEIGGNGDDIILQEISGGGTRCIVVNLKRFKTSYYLFASVLKKRMIQCRPALGHSKFFLDLWGKRKRRRLE